MKDLSYLTDSYDEGIQLINELDAPLNFVFITDQHNRLGEWARIRYPEAYNEENRDFELAANAVDSIQYILDRCPGISMVISGGDIGNDYDEDPAKIRASHEEIMDAFYRLSVPVHCCIGNHDDALGTSKMRGDDTRLYAILPDEMHARCMKNNPTAENYYYIDVDTADGGWRMIFLNTSDKPGYPDGDGQYSYGFRNEISEKQAIWFEKEALHTDRKILVFSHTTLHNDHIFGTAPYDDVLNGARVYHAMKYASNVIASIAGHVHYDNLVYDDIVTVTTLCAYASRASLACPARVIGTPSETAFDVFSIKDDILYITRFGAGENRRTPLPRITRMKRT